MRIALISDIHGNRFALDSALTDISAQSVDKVVCLGDTVQGGSQPVETIEGLRSGGFPIIMGNADAWLLNEEADVAEPTSDEQREVRQWTISQLSPTDLDFMRSYRHTIRSDLGGDTHLICFHGSPLSYNDILLPDTPKERWDETLGPFEPAIMAGGHTHTQQLRRVGRGLFINPGSVGLAYDYHLPKEKFHAEPWAEYAILTSEDRHLNVEFRRAYYDIDKLSDIIMKSGRPYTDHLIDDYAKAR